MLYMKKNVFLAFIFSFCSFSYQFLLIKISEEVVGDSFLAKSFIVGFFIIGLGLGSYLMDKAKPENPKKNLISTELKLILFVLISPIIIYSSDIIANIIFFYERNLHIDYQYDVFYLKNNMIIYKVFFFSILISIITVIGYLTGKEMPLLIYNHKEKDINKFLFYNYIGSLGSSVVIVFSLLSFNMKPENIFFLITLVNIIALIILDKKNFKFSILACLIPIAIIATSSVKSIMLYQKYNTSYFNIWEEFYDSHTKIYESITPYQKIDFVVSNDEQNLYLNGNFQFSIGREKDYHEAMVHLPYSILTSKSNKKEVLILGGGDGFLLRELFKYKNEFNISHIELDENFFNYCKKNELIKYANKRSLNKKVGLREFTDGFAYLKFNEKKYDFILIDFPYPYSYDLSKLYSKEFYSKVKSRLKEDGIAVMDIPLFRYKKIKNNNNLIKVNNVIYSTIKSVFGEKTLYFKVNEEGFVIFSNKNISFDEIIIDKTKSSYKKKNLISVLKNQQFNLKYDKKLINSIYKPTIKDFSSLHSKY